MPSSIKEMLAEANAAVPRLSPAEVREMMGRGNVLFVDVRDAPELYPLRMFWLARHGAEVVGAAMRTPPYNLILARPASEHALAALAGAVKEELPGVVGAVRFAPAIK